MEPYAALKASDTAQTTSTQSRSSMCAAYHKSARW